jgi:hypothetical protein
MTPPPFDWYCVCALISGGDMLIKLGWYMPSKSIAEKVLKQCNDVLKLWTKWDRVARLQIWKGKQQESFKGKHKPPSSISHKHVNKM